MARNRLTRSERLKSRKVIQSLFGSGESLAVHPIRVVWQKQSVDPPHPVQVAFSASRRKWKRAVDRNLIKRRMREAYRLNKNILGSHDNVAVIFLYTSDKIHTFDTMQTAMVKALQQLNREISTP